MKSKSFLIICLIFLTLVSITSVCASDDVTIDDVLETQEDAGMSEGELSATDGDVDILNQENPAIQEQIAEMDDVSELNDKVSSTKNDVKGNSSNVHVSMPEKLYKDDYFADYILVNAPEDATGDLVVKFNESVFYSDKVGPSVFIYLSPSEIDFGEYLVNVTVTGNYNYSGVFAFDVTYHLDVDDNFVYGSDSVQINSNDELSGNFNVTIDGVEYESFKKSTGAIDLNYIRLNPQLTLGNHTLVLTYLGDEYYPTKSITKNITVCGKILIPEECYSNDKVTLTLPEDAEGNLAVYITSGSSTKIFSNVKLVNGKASVTLNNLEMGHYMVIAKYTGDDYVVEEASSPLHINPQFTYPTIMLQGDKKSVSINAPGKKGTLILKLDLDGELKTFKKTLVDGKASILLSKEYCCYDILAEVIFVQQDNNGKTINRFQKRFGFDIDTPNINCKDVVVQYGSGSKYSVKCTYNNKPLVSKDVSFKINGKTIKVKTDKNGIASFKIDQPPKKYTVKIYYQGFLITERTVDVKHTLTLKDVAVKKSAKKLVLTATLKKVNGKYLKGKKITFKFNGKKVATSKTNSKGVAKVTVKASLLKNLKIGKKVTYQATYLKDSVKKSVKVE